MKKILYVFVGLFIWQNSIFASELYKCPAKKNNLSSTGISIFDGHPKQKADLAPDNADSPFPHKWTLKNTSSWLVCRYGNQGKKLFKKKLENKFKSCETAESKKDSKIYDQIICS